MEVEEVKLSKRKIVKYQQSVAQTMGYANRSDYRKSKRVRRTKNTSLSTGQILMPCRLSYTPFFERKGRKLKGWMKNRKK